MLIRNIRWVVLVLLAFSLLPTNGIAAGQSTCGEVYVVQPNDSLRDIAARCGIPVQTILTLNPFIDNRNLIYPGWVLDLSQPAAQMQIPQTGAGPRSDAFYVVKAGDTLPYIASRLQIPESDLLAVNPNLASADDLRTGQILRLTNSLNAPAAAVSPQVIDPGQEVTVLVGGFPASTELEFAGGPLGEGAVLLKRARTGSSGFLRTTLQIPASAARGNRWAIVVYPLNNANLRAVSNLLYVVDTSGPAQPILYTVRVNDTLSAIAVRFGVSMDTILDINPQIENPRVIRVGQEVLIPGALMRQQPQAGQAGLFLGPNSGPPSSEIDIFGTGFNPETTLDLRIVRESGRTGLLASSEVQTSARGTFYTTLTVPASAQPGETLLVRAITAEVEENAAPAAQFFVGQPGIPQTGSPAGQPAVTLSPSSGPPGTVFTIQVRGYPASFPITMTISGTTISGAQSNQDFVYRYQTEADGSFFARIQVPRNTNPGGSFTIRVSPTQASSSVPGLSARFQITQ